MVEHINFDQYEEEYCYKSYEREEKLEWMDNLDEMNDEELEAFMKKRGEELLKRYGIGNSGKNA